MNQNPSSSAVHIYCAVLYCLGVNAILFLLLVTFLNDSGVLFILTVWWPRPLLHWGGFLMRGFPRKQQFLPTGQNQLAVRENLQVHKKHDFFSHFNFFLLNHYCMCMDNKKTCTTLLTRGTFPSNKQSWANKLLLFSLLSKSHYYLHLVKGHGLFFSINLNSLHPRMLSSIKTINKFYW